MLDKTFDPASAEPRLYAAWEASGAFAPIDDPAAPTFSMVIPPPNVTGSPSHRPRAQQHPAGRPHAVRPHARHGRPVGARHRPRRHRDPDGGGAEAWPPRATSAGIDIGPGGLRVDRVWAWKAESGGTITNQLRRLGASCDWSRERFTLDAGLSHAVRHVFVTLHRQGLIYRDKRLVNWDPQFQTAISDLEVETREVQGKMWHFAYPLEGEPIDGVSEIVIATTRPETMLGDGAVAVHPDDRALHQVRRPHGAPAHRRPPDPDHRRPLSGPGKGLRRRQDHWRARLQRLPGRHAPWPVPDLHHGRAGAG